MPNWAEGTLKLRGKRENIVSALKDMLLTGKATKMETKYDGDFLRFTSTDSYFYIKGTLRAFIGSNSIDMWLDDDFQIVELTHFKQAWGVEPYDYQEISKKHDVDIKIFAFECGMEFTQELEISKGEIIKHIIKDDYDNYDWDVPFSHLGG